MRPSLLVGILLPLVSAAGDATSKPPDGARPHATRHLVVRLVELRDASTPLGELRVQGGVSTILTARPWWGTISARGTGVGGRGERPFEVLVGAGRVFITPTRPLLAGERWPFLLRLSDGTSIPLQLVAADRADGEVVVSLEDDLATELRVELAAMTGRAEGLAVRLERALREQESEDFALASLLAGGHAQLTAMEKAGERPAQDLEGWRVRLETFAGHDSSKVALVMTITNASAAPLQFAAGAVFSGATLQPVASAWRAHPEVIAPGALGYLSVVLDRSAFGPDGADRVTLDVRAAAAPVLHLELGAGNFDRPTVRWPF